MSATPYTTIGVAVAALALGSARLAGQRAHSAPACASLGDVTARTDQAIATAQKIRTATSVSERLPW